MFEFTGELSERSISCGVHVTINEWTLSIQWGPGTYTDNHNLFPDHMGRLRANKQPKDPLGKCSSSVAEIALWHKNGKMVELVGDAVEGYVSAANVGRILNVLAELPKDGDPVSAIRDILSR